MFDPTRTRKTCLLQTQLGPSLFDCAHLIRCNDCARPDVHFQPHIVRPPYETCFRLPDFALTARTNVTCGTSPCSATVPSSPCCGCKPVTRCLLTCSKTAVAFCTSPRATTNYATPSPRSLRKRVCASSCVTHVTASVTRAKSPFRWPTRTSRTYRPNNWMIQAPWRDTGGVTCQKEFFQTALFGHLSL